MQFIFKDDSRTDVEETEKMAERTPAVRNHRIWQRTKVWLKRNSSKTATLFTSLTENFPELLFIKS
jgi:hypothetical protein